MQIMDCFTGVDTERSEEERDTGTRQLADFKHVETTPTKHHRSTVSNSMASTVKAELTLGIADLG